MKCSICNGTLRYKNGLYVCESCGSTQQVSSTFQNEEVFILPAFENEYLIKSYRNNTNEVPKKFLMFSLLPYLGT